MTWKNIFDLDGDGVKTAKEFATTLRMFVYLGCAVYVIIAEGYYPEDRFSDWEFISVVTASFGAAMFEKLLEIKKINGS